MISVIVPVYKVEKYLQKCVSSIQNQTYGDIEIILVNDGSPDNSGKICDELAKKDSRIKVIHQKNQGQAVARNLALDIAKGEYITFVDSDDTVNPRMLELLVSILKKNEADIAICGHRVVYEESYNESEDKKVCIEEVLDKEKLWQEIFGRLNNAVWNKMYISSKIGDLRFPKGIVHGEDLIFNLEYLIKCEKGVITNAPLYNYLQHKDSVTGSDFTEKKLYEIDSKDRALHIVEEYAPEQLKNAEKYCFRARMNVIRAIYKAGKDKQYLEKLNLYKQYVTEKYNLVKRDLKTKEKIEFNLYMRLKPVYKLIVTKI
ncbi:glycosyltransferase family 2 protein [[Ruminococcus] lactaris]|uniref:Glycosyltransferase n=1 Tax=[Ruminococcus] lactaris TaxID=46228 RepID=A0A415CW69_9FIRM|nr:glycosyltransferase [[Ruminococcus] lactaris]RHJ58017.1 glycosyltransferase [[Ruminococcus] lactaris]